MPESAPPKEPQSAGAVLMIRPASFGFNPQTAASNAFQRRPEQPPSRLQSLVLEEFDALADKLARAGVRVVVGADTESPAKPDAVFPNNWVSFHADGAVVTYPMMAPNRRLERRDELIGTVLDAGFRASRTVDLSHRESQGKYLEGTGSLVLDRTQRIAYASLSPRTDLEVLGEFALKLDYELVTFESEDGGGRSVYHTNVMMAVGPRFAVVCGDSITQARQRDAVYARLESSHREVVEISVPQMHAFAGNLLALSPAGADLIALSATAWRSLQAPQRRALERHGAILAAEVPVIERHGGGSVRCMLAEIHLPARESGRAVR